MQSQNNVNRGNPNFSRTNRRRFASSVRVRVFASSFDVSPRATAISARIASIDAGSAAMNASTSSRSRSINRSSIFGTLFSDASARTRGANGAATSDVSSCDASASSSASGPDSGTDVAFADVEILPVLPQLLDRMAAVAEAGDHFLASAGLVLFEDRVDRLDHDRQRDAVVVPLLHQRPILRIEDERRPAAKREVRFDFLEVGFGRRRRARANVPCGADHRSRPHARFIKVRLRILRLAQDCVKLRRTRIDMEPIAPRAEVTVYSPLFSPFRQQLQGSAVSIGRASDCSIPVKDRYLSRKHAEIVADHGVVDSQGLRQRQRHVPERQPRRARSSAPHRRPHPPRRYRDRFRDRRAQHRSHAGRRRTPRRA